MDINSLNEKLDGIVNLINSRFNSNDDDHSRIETQVKSTNGRVRSLEKWRYAMGGALVVLSFILSFLTTIVIAYFK